MQSVKVLSAALSVLVGVGLWAGAAWLLVDHQLFLLRSVEGVAEVVALDETVSGSGSRRPGTKYYTPVLRFWTTSGREVQFRTSGATNPPAYEVGERVEVAYLEANPEDVRVARFGWGSVVMVCFGSLFLLLGGYVFRARYRNHRLLRRGTPIRTKLFRLTLNASISVNGQNPWVIVTEWRDPSTRAKRFFKSENLWSDPTSWLSDQPIRVYVDPKNPGPYFMDLSFLTGEHTPRDPAAESASKALTVAEEALALRGISGELADDPNRAEVASTFLLDGSALGLCLDASAASPPTPRAVLEEARGRRVFVHFDRRKASGATSPGHPTHAVLLIEEDFERVQFGAKRLSCTLQAGEKCAVPWDAIFAIVVPATKRGFVWLCEAPSDACITSSAGKPTPVADVALAHQLPAFVVNGEQIQDGQFELLVDGEWFPGITSVKWGSVLGFNMKLRLSGSPSPLRSYIEARARAEKRPTFLVELGYSTKSSLVRGIFMACRCESQQTDESDVLVFRPSSYNWAKQSKTSGMVGSGWGY